LFARGSDILHDVKWNTDILTGLLNRKFSGILCLLVILSALHLSTISNPDQLVFDEQHYVPAAESIAEGEGTDRTEHPPLGQLLIAAGIKIFGSNPIGWRLIPIIFGLAFILVFYLVCLRLGMNERNAFLAAFLLAFENLTFIQSGVAMLDVFSLTFMLLGVWLYLRKNYESSAISAGLAALCKLNGFLVVPVILFHWFFTRRRELRPLVSQVIGVPVTFLLLMPLLDFAIWHKWLNPLQQTATMLKITSGSTFAKYPSELLSRPWEWVSKPEILSYWIDPHYLAMISPPVWALIIPSMIFVLYKALKGSNPSLFSLLWFVFMYLFWIPVSLLSDRISYIYYFYPAVAAVCIGLALASRELEHIVKSLKESTGKKLLNLITPVYLLVCLGAFVVLTPVGYWWKAPLCLIAYFAARYFSSGQAGVQKEDTGSISKNIAGI